MRPLYESQSDLDNEKKIAATFAKRFKLVEMKNPPREKIDYSFFRLDRIVAWGEIKRRSFKHDRFPTMMINADKWINGLHYEAISGIPFLLIIKYEDGIKYMRASEASGVYYGWGGRTDRQDKQDTGPVIYAPIENFKSV